MRRVGQRAQVLEFGVDEGPGVVPAAAGDDGIVVGGTGLWINVAADFFVPATAALCQSLLRVARHLTRGWWSRVAWVDRLAATRSAAPLRWRGGSSVVGARTRKPSGSLWLHRVAARRKVEEMEAPSRTVWRSR